MRRPDRLFFALFVLFMLLSGGCPGSPSSNLTVHPTPPPPTERESRSEDYVVLTAKAGDTYESLARHYLSDGKLAYLISDFNRDAPIKAGMTIVVPLYSENPGGLYPDFYQTVPVLCYHRFSSKRSSDKITVSAQTFDRQMAYLKRNGYTVLTLEQFYDFIDYRRRPPRKSVLITIDDGLKTAHTIAFPILKKYGFPAVLFINTGTITDQPNPHTLDWGELRKLSASGLIEVESHSVTHDDLTRIPENRLRVELEEPRQLIRSMLGRTATAFAYPYGLINGKIMDMTKKCGYRTGFTVIRGGNPFFSYPYALNRSMVYNSERMEDFAKSLQTYRQD